MKELQKQDCYLIAWFLERLAMYLGHKAYWAVRQLNFDAKVTGERCLLQLNEMEIFWNEAYENAKLYRIKQTNGMTR